MPDDFISKLELKVREQINARNVGFLLGAGSSFLNGAGYPLAGDLWGRIADKVPEQQRTDIQTKLDGGAQGIEQALDLLDTGQAVEQPHRRNVMMAIAEVFSTIHPPLDHHRPFVSTLYRRNERQINIFSLNYDPLIERACENEHARLFDGFHGHESAFFDAGSFQHDIAILPIGGRGIRQRRQIEPMLRLIKLHGSLGWYECPENGIRRTGFSLPMPANTRRLMIPPQHRKATDTVLRPYTTLWTEFRNRLVHGPDAINRLVTLGYGMADEHVNDVIEGALARGNFTLIIVTMVLGDQAFTRWSQKRNVIVVTRDRCSLYGTAGAGHPSFWAFENIVQELSRQ